ncbi:hypothetical protein Tco_0452412 [Tanacetum coccineum]
MVAYLKKPTRSEGFQEIVDFLNGSHIRYALTKNPTIYVSLIEKFWQTATVRTVDNGEQEINAIVDGKEFTITEASVRRHLQLADADGISVLPNTEIFDQLTLMGYVLTDDKLTFQKDEAVYQERGDSMERAAATTTSLEAVWWSQTPRDHRGASVQTRFEREPKFSYDSPLGGGNTPRSDEDSMTLQELTALCTKLSDRVLALETDLRQTKKVYDAARVHTYSRRRRAVSTGRGGVSTASRIVSTAGLFNKSTSLFLHQVQQRKKGFTENEWEDIRARVEADKELTQKLQAWERDKYSEVDQARMLVDLINQRKRYFVAPKAEAKRNKPMTKAQQRTYMSNYIKHMGSHIMQQLKRYIFDELKELFETTMKHVSTFKSIEIEDKERQSELAAGSS